MSRPLTHRSGATGVLVVALLLLTLVIGVSSASAATVTGGTSTLFTDPGQSNAMFVGRIIPFALPGSSMALTTDAFRFAFPVASGSLNTTTLAGSILHKGGLQFWGRETMSAWTQLNFTRVVASLGVTSTVSAIYNADSTRHTILALNTTNKKVTKFVSGGHHWVRISNIKVGMSNWLVNQLKLAFPSYAPSTHFLGTISITIRL
jgi:hypothetical protein